MKSLLVSLIFLFITSITNVKSNSTYSGFLSTYTGNCVCFRKIVLPSQKVTYQQLFQAPGKIIVDRSAKKLTMYFSGTLICSGKLYLDYLDNTHSTEDFALAGGGVYNGRLYYAERTFIMDAPRRSKDSKDILGYTFQISPYALD